VQRLLETKLSPAEKALFQPELTFF
jgi:hypothetical protein